MQRRTAFEGERFVLGEGRRRSAVAAAAVWVCIAADGCAKGIDEGTISPQGTPGIRSDAAPARDASRGDAPVTRDGSTGSAGGSGGGQDSSGPAEDASSGAAGGGAGDSAITDVVVSDVSGPCQTPTGPCVNALAAGWNLVLFESNRNSACPASFTARDGVASPMAGAGACDCSCTVGAGASCTTGMMATRFGTTSACSSAGASINVSSSACTGLAGTVNSFFSATPLPAAVTCSAAPTTDATRLTSTQVRACDVPAACREDVCNGDVPPGFSACVARDGDMPCPPGWATRTLVGDSAQLSCSACTCQATATCTAGRISFFSDVACSTLFGAFDVNGSCQSTNGGGMIRAFTYSATVSNPQCTANGPRTASVQLAAPRTVCCK